MQSKRERENQMPDNSSEFLEVKALSSKEMRGVEQRGVDLGLSKLCMMENAGASIAKFVYAKFRDNEGTRRVVLVGGTGNNGGDVFVAARHLAFWKRYFQISLFLVGEEEGIRADEARTNWEILKRCEQVMITVLNTEKKVQKLEKELSSAHAIVVGIFGTGFKGSPRPLQSKIIETINDFQRADVVSVDLPSGLDADTGSYEIAVVSDYTITMHAPKVGMLSEAGRKICGNILIANIGIPV
jgi:hydroxyethylthiazole kinase-like uncharacterized protein yjeF